MNTEQFPRYEDVPLVQDAIQAAAHIVILNNWLREHPRSMNDSLRQVRRWYAIWDGTANSWILGFSKFIGYANMTGERYALYRSSPKDKREKLSGRITENKHKALWLESAPVEKKTVLHDEILPFMLEFLRSQGLNEPRSDYSIRLLNGFTRQRQ